MKVNLTELNKRVEDKLVTVQKHPDADLFIYNYTPEAQFKKLWDDYTLMSRGLILDGSGEIVARPFSKFFNLEEFKGELPNENFFVSEKMDGSLGILYPLNGDWAIATRGSFTSDQAIKGTKMLQQYIERVGTGWIIEGSTFLFEIIYPSNRIVVDYGDLERLVLLAVIDNETGRDYPLELFEYLYKVEQLYGAKDLSELRAAPKANAEGYVVRFASGLRVKLKYAEYVRLHRIMTQSSSRTIWEFMAIDSIRKEWNDDAKWIALSLHLDQNEVRELLKNDDLFSSLLDKVPDEFYGWVKSTVKDLQDRYDQHIKLINKAYELVEAIPEKKDKAIYISQLKSLYKNVLMARMAGNKWEHLVWLMIYPEHTKPFLTEDE